ncbi:uncharacterized protein AMSG_01785 [Thecamonas trahens ATCC 50062]|uniref:Phytanoyl-CoA dioxygenase n=1 Tax=Thecamonas trahens ATCC 50062 TaxID=461836 RepID=A0A0L0DTC0_THETB|nr:hypothetical protein AMSG_01785 [Thecamonas trahens ATCC 50062]KNC55520.1 hypothetical protein AMSG_01785 [Thecamonas trahens ATCC 50062]|eukprot:XP_013761298.1 hypothetical protein AMSG_01785 [Thecamonas trahens ATCC 50062]
MSDTSTPDGLPGSQLCKASRANLTDEERARRKEAAMRAAGTWREETSRSDAEMRVLFPRYPAADGSDDDDVSAWRISYAPSDTAGIAAALEVYGMVVVDVLTSDEADATAADLLADASAQANPAKATAALDFNDPTTWESRNWPKPKSKFLFGSPAFTQLAFAMRTHPAIYEVFRGLYGGEEKLWASIDNWGVMRGTRNLRMRNEETGEVEDGVERPQWRTSLGPHWDCNPHRIVEIDRAEGHAQRYQGLVALVDCPITTGTFACVPGSSAYLDTWVSEHFRDGKAGLANRSVRPKASDPMAAYMQPIPLRKGQMVIWHFELLHANVPNTSSNMRLIQFIRMMPAWDAEQRAMSRSKDRHSPPKIWKRYPEIADHVRTTYSLSSLQLRLTGFLPWSDDDDDDDPPVEPSTAAAADCCALNAETA